ncbi:MAG: hypothetical protein ACPGPS_01590 [Rubripirellula sp.]
MSRIEHELPSKTYEKENSHQASDYPRSMMNRLAGDAEGGNRRIFLGKHTLNRAQLVAMSPRFESDSALSIM